MPPDPAPLDPVSSGFHSFKELYKSEAARLGDPIGQNEPLDVPDGAGGEPWVAFTTKERFGLALSGGGIRSATFNLGLLQSLAQLGALRHVDYLSTVSGGGYVGGFWNAWLLRNPGREPVARFPMGSDEGGGESPEVRHLREFSRFLLPRAGLFQTEFWGIVMTALGGLLPSLLAALAVMTLLWSVWAGLMSVVLAPFSVTFTHWDPVWQIAAAALFFWAFFHYSESDWARSHSGERNRDEALGYQGGSFVGAALMIVGWIVQAELRPAIHRANLAVLTDPDAAFTPVLLMAAVSIALLFLRVLHARFSCNPAKVSYLAGFERAATRFLGLTCGVLALSILWWLAGFLRQSSLDLARTGAGAGVSTGLFLWLRKWLAERPKETHGGNLLRTVLGVLKRAAPKFLANLSWLLLFVLTGAGMQWCYAGPQGAWAFWQISCGGLVVAGLALWLFDPTRVGMHELYRSRISTCYLGASNRMEKAGSRDKARARPDDADQARTRSTNERPGDDLTLGELRLGRRKKSPDEDLSREEPLPENLTKPLHLVCTAANNLSGDPVGTLYRGARSAVLSPHGISLGGQTARLDHLRLSSALTASAAAFNSHMGRISMELGPAVTFLLSAFNLRLGLWVPHPEHPRQKPSSFPGRLFFAELLGRSRTDGKNLLLSDGNHFENFGVYELVRRHCRHIIVSDCGADPEVAFDDLANVFRRIREDFRVEIELDVSRLRPGTDGLAQQHAVVGTIHYNGLGGMDKGTILYFKSALTGDEPPDVLQYWSRNKAFPNESTANQFYDEAQWESYRRLGEHAGRVVLGFLDRPEENTDGAVSRLFRDARSRWHPSPDHVNEDFVAMTQRCAELEENLASSGPPLLRSEFFSEAAELAAAWPQGVGEKSEEIQILSFLLRGIQIMEDVWVAADLEQFWSHPLNEGWMHYFHRWAATPSFRRWWPVLAPIYSVGFREFVKERFAVGTTDPAAQRDNERGIAAAQLVLRDLKGETRYQSSQTWRRFLQTRSQAGSRLPGKNVLGYEIRLLDRNGALSGPAMLVGFTLVQELQMPAGSDFWVAEWQSDEYFVPPSLHGGGFVSRMLDAIIARYEAANRSAAENAGSPRFTELHVHFAGSAKDAGSARDAHSPRIAPATPGKKSQMLGAAARHERVQEIEFYKSRGFRYRTPENPETGEITLHLRLQTNPSAANPPPAPEIPDARTTAA